jgi:hypothetical protein
VGKRVKEIQGVLEVLGKGKPENGKNSRRYYGNLLELVAWANSGFVIYFRNI